MKLTLLSGTNRPGSNTRKIVSIIADLYQDLGHPVEILDLADLPQDIFLPQSYAKKPDSFGRFSETILQSDGVHIVTPEYNGGVPGILKYFIDMLKFPESFEHRPVVFTGLAGGMWGALRPVEQLQAIFGYRNAYICPERVFLPHVSGLLSDDGNLTDASIVDRLRSQATAFVKFAGQLQAIR
ncbi:NAD(P)H-dependent FMN reductase [Roseimicrobium gellanilyticum]|uniref:NAD(P)H-dependent FMN reductase n=1 Tax=Roseimicrobium gellanilyticum TaxID=748857 RepID=A0A366HLE3_9BACT|nr:NAD(P)H-dependent oxidoreductase [Roseimicrobium gellanilyticum]RBP43758.1 NAD(P)H-dependent FMN reductase [Roseimicrobium gellanilyticum]